MSEIVDSGERREFDTGAVRDIQTGKGRCDLMPFLSIAAMFEVNGDNNLAQIFRCLNQYVYHGRIDQLSAAVNILIALLHGDAEFAHTYEDIADSLLDVSIHYEDGCKKYGERNWEKGIPVHSYIDSGVRHLLKYMKHEDDERHDRACIWNFMGAIYTHLTYPELIDLPCKDEVMERKRQAEEAIATANDTNE